MREHVVCPKCKTPIIKIYEICEAWEYWTQDEEGHLEPGPNEAIVKDTIRVEGECLNEDCGYTWRIRKAANITELPNWPDDEYEDTVSNAETNKVDEEVPIATDGDQNESFHSISNRG